jgi:transposase
MPQSSPLYVGMAVHQESMAVASVAPAHHAEVTSRGAIGTRPCGIDQRIRNRPSKSPPLVFVSEAGPCGHGLSRDLTHQGHVCWVVAPSFIPIKPGDRLKTNRRDAITLARLMRSGDLPPVHVPRVADAAIRDLCRARGEAIRALKAAKCRLNAFLLRQDIRSTGPATWSPAHRRWLREGVCPTPAQPMVFQAYVRAVTEPTERLTRLDQALHPPGQTWRLAPVVDALQALRGVPCTVAVPTVADLGDLTRFDNPRPLMHDPGFTPSQYATGERRRRALVEGAWADRDPANVSRHRPPRLEKRPTPTQASSWKAQGRRCRRQRRLSARGQNPPQVVVASARERSALMWAMAQPVPITSSVLRRS